MAKKKGGLDQLQSRVIGSVVMRFDSLPALSTRYTSKVTSFVGNCGGDSQGGINSGKIQQVVNMRTVISPVTPLPTPCSGISGTLNWLKKLPVLLSIMKRFRIVELAG